VESVLGIGKTTKAGHSGFGLPIAKAAIEALGGTLNLQSAIGGGAKYELRWER
jgi:signal transduction histidine kinase